MRDRALPSPVASAGWLIPVVVLLGVALSLLVSYVPIFVAAGALCAIILLVVFLQRPDLGLLTVLFVRSTTDVSLGHFSAGETPGKILSSPLNVGLILILIFAGGVTMLRRGVPFLRLPGGTPFTLLLLTGLVGLVGAVVVTHIEGFLFGFDQWLRVVAALVVYAVAAHVFRGPRALQAVIDVLAASFIIPAGVGLYQFITGQAAMNTGVGARQIYGTFVHPNAFGFFLVLIFGVFLCQALAQTGSRKLLALSIIAVSGGLLFVTYARSAWEGATVVVLVVGALRKRAFLVLAPVVFIAAVVTVPTVSHRLQNPFEGSFASRTIIWQTSAGAWTSKTRDDMGVLSTLVNRLSGTGPGSTQFLTFFGSGSSNAEHNDYLDVLLEYGVVGLGAYLAMYLAILIFGYRAWRRCADHKMAAVPLGFVAVTLAFMVMSLTENIFAGTQNQVYFWTLAGLTVAVNRWSARAGGNSSRIGNEELSRRRLGAYDRAPAS